MTVLLLNDRIQPLYNEISLPRVSGFVATLARRIIAPGARKSRGDCQKLLYTPEGYVASVPFAPLPYEVTLLGRAKRTPRFGRCLTVPAPEWGSFCRLTKFSMEGRVVR